MNLIDQQAKAALVSRRQSIQRVFRENAEGARLLQAEVEPDWPDRAAAQGHAGILHRLTESERNELAEIDAALVRIAEGTYGACAACGESIGRHRLRALPEARLCISCGEVGPVRRAAR